MPYKDRDKQRAFQREWIKRRRAEWFAANGPCAQCGTIEDLIAASPKPNKPVPHRVWTYSEKRRDAVLAECVVLCRKCYLERRWPAPEHGTLARYESRVHGCRCEKCRAARNRSEQARRKRRKARTPEQREAAVAAWRERERRRLRERARTLTPESVRAIGKRWRREFRPIELPPSAHDLGRPLVEHVFLAIAAEGRDGVVTGDIVNESALASSDATLLIEALLRNGLVVRERSRLVARRVRRAEQRMQRAAVEFQTLRRRCEPFDETVPDPECDDDDEIDDDERLYSRLDTIERVMYRLFDRDD